MKPFTSPIVLPFIFASSFLLYACSSVETSESDTSVKMKMTAFQL